MLRFLAGLIVTGGLLSGCALTGPSSADLETRMTPPTIAPEQVAALPAGARVEVGFQSDTAEAVTFGTVLHASPQGVALLNCERTGRTESGTPVLSKVPYVSRLFKNTGVGRERVPVQWVSIREISTARVLAPPPPDYVPPALDIDTNDEPYFERIGIDFDFNVDEQGRTMAVEVH